MCKGQVFSVMAALALICGIGGAASARAEFCADIAKLQQEAEAGKPQAQMELASCYGWGKGVPRDVNVSVDWTRKAAEQGYAPAQTQLGYSYASGNGVSQDEQVAEQWFRKAAQGLPALAKRGDALAQYALAGMYLSGKGGFPEDDKLAVQWYRKAAEQGYAHAQSQLGHMYRGGIRVPKDEAQAIIWLRKAAEQGVPWAQLELGEMCEQGKGVAQDFSEAEKWYRKAGEFIPVARNQAQSLEWKKPCLSKCYADANTCKAGCMGVTDADGSRNAPSSRATCNNLCAEAQTACNKSCE